MDSLFGFSFGRGEKHKKKTLKFDVFVDTSGSLLKPLGRFSHFNRICLLSSLIGSVELVADMLIFNLKLETTYRPTAKITKQQG